MQRRVGVAAVLIVLVFATSAILWLFRSLSDDDSVTPRPVVATAGRPPPKIQLPTSIKLPKLHDQGGATTTGAQPLLPRPKTNPSPSTQTPAIAGQVIDAMTGRPVSGARVYPDRKPREGTTTDGRGRFILVSRSRSERVVVFAAPGYRHKAQKARPVPGVRPSLMIRLSPCETGSIEGEITCAGPPPKQVTIYLDLYPQTQPWSGGRFHLPQVNVGPHTIGVVAGDRGTPLEFKRVQVKAGEHHKVKLRIPETGRIEGILFGPEGKPLPLAILAVGRLVLSTDKAGRFASGSILPGRQRVSVAHRLVGRLALTELELAPGEERKGLIWRVEPRGQGSVVVRVTRADGEVAKDEALTILALEGEQAAGPGTIAGPPQPDESGNSLAPKGRLQARSAAAVTDRRGGRTDSRGECRFRYLGPGRYRVFCGGETSTVELRGNEEAVLQLELPGSDAPAKDQQGEQGEHPERR